MTVGATRSWLIAHISAERERQIEIKGYDSEHDDFFNMFDWVAIVAHELGQAACYNDPTMKPFREQMIKVAAVALAALEWSYR